jgi:nucleotide-binding universal stress UspA family protein
MRVLIAVDDSEWSNAAIRYVESMAWPARSEMLVLSVAPSIYLAYSLGDVPAGFPAISDDIATQWRRHHETIATRDAERIAKLGFSTRALTAEGDPRAVILETASRERSDLIIVGSHGRSGLKKLLLGSVSSHIVTHAPCSVLVVKLPSRS